MLKKFFDNRFFRWVRYVRQQLQNQRQNRQCIGEDRDGNKYYQYYSYWGLPTRRQIRFKKLNSYQMTDLVYYRWLHNQQFDPPTEAEKEIFYLEEQLRYQRALEWDKKEKQHHIEFAKRREELLLRDKAMAELQKELEAKSQLKDIKSKRSKKAQETKRIDQV